MLVSGTAYFQGKQADGFPNAEGVCCNFLAVTMALTSCTGTYDVVMFEGTTRSAMVLCACLQTNRLALLSIASEDSRRTRSRYAAGSQITNEAEVRRRISVNIKRCFLVLCCVENWSFVERFTGAC